MRTGQIVCFAFLATTVFDVGVCTPQTPPGSEGNVGQSFECVPCELLFSKLTWSSNGERVQHVEMQERGEPKSGTGFMFNWAEGALRQACEYLRASFGHDSCNIEIGGFVDDDSAIKKLSFDPRLGRGDARCQCINVDRVTISISRYDKHALPVEKSCPWSHPRGLSGNHTACTPADGRPVENHDDLWRCMQEADCKINDDRLQMVVVRDPRPTVVSTYYHHLRFEKELQFGTLDQFVEEMLPVICQWVAIRYILFEGLMGDRVQLFWYERANEYPEEWYHQWYRFVGLNLPALVVEDAAGAAISKKAALNLHPGGGEATSRRTYKDEVGPVVLATFDDVLRVWLPPVLLAKLGVPPL